MSKANRISLSLFEDGLIELINASAKIFPITIEDIENNYNPNEYEYGRYGREIYIWLNDKWQYIVADDTDISFNELKDIPVSFNPKEHTHKESDIVDLDKYTKDEVDSKLNNKADKNELHYHDNKYILDSITSETIDKINNSEIHMQDNTMHVSKLEKDTWNTVIYKADKTYVDSKLYEKSNIDHNHNGIYYTKEYIDEKLNSKSDILHNHNGLYYTKVDIDSKLSTKSDLTHKHKEDDIVDLDKYSKDEIDSKMEGKSDKNHTHEELHEHSNKSILDKITETDIYNYYDLSNLQYIDDIKNGYTEGHAHQNMNILNSIDESKINEWNSASNHTNDSTKHITDSERILFNTVINKAEKIHNHDGSEILINGSNPLDIYINKLVLDITDALEEITTLMSYKSDEIHTHDSEDIFISSNIPLNQVIEDIDVMLDGKADKGHTHIDKADVTYVTSELSKKADKSTLEGHTRNSTIHVTQSDKDKFHNHTNIETLEKLTDKDGVLQYNGEDIGVGGVFTIKREEFVAEEGQTLFNLTLGEYTVNSNRLSIYIYGIKQPNNSFLETSSTSFTMSTALNEGDRVIAEWIESVDISGLYEGHGKTHAIGGGDEITPSMIGADLTITSDTKPSNGASMWYEVIE